MVFLQKKCQARRIYCHVVGTGTGSEGYKEAGIIATFGPGQVEFLNLVYKNARLNPVKVGYVEAHGTGTKVRRGV